MADRIMVWHVPTLPAVTPVFYADRDYKAVALRIYAARAPGAGDLTVDILDDGVSIMDSNTAQTAGFKFENAYIEYNTLVGAFTVNELVTGDSSGATGYVRENSTGKLVLYDPSATKFTVGETINGSSSSASAVVTAYVKEKHQYLHGTTAGRSHAILPKNATAEEAAQDFITSVEIDEGSWVSLSLLDAAGASGITVQLELDALSVSTETRPWAE